ncbi:2-hydroxyacid dehydrogenase [Dethiosulfovibrio salsuginis]|uniref:Phosphoglycerate dehydrogenase n=1 Tax=Dethiosulfovibrio salsuginis TaxID=561720 RepID=A0A1X7L5B0_9BACT|nr:2-hydroxyacid dehydrogenase [Dethiosulfovibrio salsuginis]SMG49056.1 Phosphoglycerate dehydrogenase [Dethiosulfovibrio salsuginis]
MSKRIGISFGPKGIEEKAKRILGDKGEIVWLSEESDRVGAIERCDLVLGQFFSEKEFSPEEWGALERVPAVHTVSAGVDQVPVGRLGAHTDLYANVGGWAPPIAEHVLAMALCCSRRLVQQTNDMASGDFKYLGYGLKTLKGKVALMVGYGGIARETAKELSTFGMEVQGLGRSVPEDPLLSKGWAIEDLKAALAGAELVVICLPLNSRTKGLFDRSVLSAMKEDCIFVNIARAAIVDERALYERAASCPNFLVALDVWWDEPREGGEFKTETPLLELPNVVGSAHNSNQTEIAMDHALEVAMENCGRILTGDKAQGRIDKGEYL